MKSSEAVKRESATERLVRWKHPLLWVIALFAVLHFVHLKADFPLHSQFAWEAAPMADEGWYSSSAVNEWMGRGWVLPGDFNPGVALPVWPAMAWVSFHIGGMGIVSLRALEVLVFFVVVLQSYRMALVFEGEGVGLFAVFFLMTSAFCFAFSRLGFLELPMMMFLMAAVLAIARTDRQTASRYVLAGVLTALSVLTKTLVVFLLPGLLYVAIERSNFQFVAAAKRIACALSSCAVVLVAYYVLYVRHQQVAFNYLFTANMNGEGPSHLAEQIIALSRPLRKGWSTDVLFFWVGVASIGTAVLPRLRYLWRRPLFVISQLWIFGYIAMMWLHNNATPRYYVPMLPALFFVGAMLLDALEVRWPTVAKAFLALLLVDAAVNVAETLYFVARPTYTLLNAADGVRQIVSKEPGIILSHNAFELSLFTGLPGINQGYGEEPIRWRAAHYRPRWWVKQGFWDDGSMMATQIGDQYRFEQVAEFPALNHNPGLIVYRLVPIAESKAVGTDAR